MKVFIHSIPRETATLVSEFRDPTSGKKLNKTKMGNCKDKIQALYSGKVGGLMNGLSYKPWIEGGIQKVDDRGNKLTLQDKEEERWGLKKGYLTNKAWRKGESLKSEDMTYFQSKSWALNDGTTILDTNNFDECMFYYVALDSKYVANSEKEWKEHKWPHATHYISLENESDELQYLKNKRIRDAMAKLANEILTLPRKKDFIRLLGLASYNTELSEEMTENLLFNYIDKNTNSKPDNIDRFEELFELVKTDKGREELYARTLLKKAMDSRVVYEKSDTYTWNRSKGPIVLGEKYSQAVDFLLNPKKREFIEELEAEIKAKLL